MAACNVKRVAHNYVTDNYHQTQLNNVVSFSSTITAPNLTVLVDYLMPMTCIVLVSSLNWEAVFNNQAQINKHPSDTQF